MGHRSCEGKEESVMFCKRKIAAGLDLSFVGLKLEYSQSTLHKKIKSTFRGLCLFAISGFPKDAGM